MKKLFFLLMLLAFSLPATAAGKKALVGGTLINGLGSTPLHNSVVLVDGELIERVGTVDTMAVPDGYEVISTEGMSWMYG
jgi:hypothetical protein